MSIAGAIDVPVEIIGGLVCDTAPDVLPSGVSPDCQDCSFAKSAVETRPGLAPLAQLNGNVVNYLKTFVTSNGTKRAMSLTDIANLYKETAPNAMTLVQQLADANPQVAVPVYGKSTTLFQREWIAISDGQNGIGIPRQFDDALLDRVSQEGPGVAPTATDENVQVNVVASPAGATQPAAVAIAVASESGFLVTITTAAAHGLSVGQSTTIAGVGVAQYNGTFPVLAVLSNVKFQYILGISGLAASGGGTSASATATIQTTAAHGFVVGQLVTTAGIAVGGYNGTFAITGVPDATHFTFTALTGGLAASGNGTASAAGSIPAGVHQVSVCFVTRKGYITKPAPPVSWTASGGKRVALTGIPIGPPNVVQRILIFTGAAGASFFYLPPDATNIYSGSTIVTDNTTTSTVVDFADAVLLAGTNADALFDLQVLGECAGVESYSDRLFWWGERNKLFNLLNMEFCGGFSNPGLLPNLPLGWTPDAVFSPGGASANKLGGPVIWGDAYAIVGDGATPTRGLLTQAVAQDFFKVPIIQANTDYSVRVRVCKNLALAAGTLHVNLKSVSGAFTTVGLQLTAAQVTTGYVEYTADLTAPLTTIPADLVLQIYADGTPTNGGVFYIGTIQIYPTLQPFLSSQLRSSKAEDPESYDGTDGFLNIAENDGYAVRNCYEQRARLYVVKEHSLHTTQDDGVNEPAQWTIDRVSAKVGTPSCNGTGLGEDWAIIADRNGLYITRGGEPVKISQEVGHSASGQTLAWDQINWQYGSTLWVLVDTEKKKILVGAPFGAATTPSAVLMMDYRDIDSEQGIETSPAIRLSYRGQKIVSDKSRKWSPWSMSANSCALIERADGTAHIWMGAGAGVPAGTDTGYIYDLLETQLTDYTTKQQIPSYYTTAFIPQREANQATQSHEHRKFFPYLATYIEGSGFVNFTAHVNSLNFTQQLPSLILSNPAYGDLEMTLNVLGERVAWKISQSGAASWFRLQKFTPAMMGAPWSPVRGVN
ncbi:MAG TPA: hypothetical protein VKQ28_00800 [Candidatus Acidoferrum sp.]|nr:hypothetical protein [Candidatus Acidoferrum sp.]